MWEAEIRGIMGPDQTAAKVHETPSQQEKSWVWLQIPIIPAMAESLK
jgi:hypothetical protein